MYYSALIGKPTEHSVSHVMFEEMARVASVPDSYKHLKIDVEPDRLSEALQAFRTLGFRGINVTLPHKLAVMEYVDELDPVARELGAVNTITFGEKTVGYNTDWLGLYTPLRKHSEQRTFDEATIFGTGGAARAAIYACKRLGISTINVVYRATPRDNKLRDLQDNQHTLGINLHEYKDVVSCVERADLVINATSTGMIGHDPTPFDLMQLDSLDLSGKIFYDAVFNPLRTPLLEYFKVNGATVIDGLWMMLFQGVAALSLWTGQDINLSETELNTLHVRLEKELFSV